MKMTRWLAASACAALMIGSSFAADNEGWVDLFNGKDLDGWIQRGGKAKYAAEDGCIVGRSVAGTPNSFLCTRKNYANFILELDFKVNPALNSGVQFRSDCFDAEKTLTIDGKKIKVEAGRVHGYQCEIDMDDKKARWWTGGIYDEGRRKWLYPGPLGGKDDAFTAQGAKLCKHNDWNHLRIEADGDSMKIFLNGELRSAIQDSMTPTGLIGLQVHGVGKDKTKEGMEVRWRNVRIKELKPKACAAPTADAALCADNAACADGYTPIFDGKTSTGWRSIAGPEFPKTGWEIKDGAITVLGKKGGDIITAKKYTNFDLCFEFKITSGANSGVKYFIQGDSDPKNRATGYEYQVLDDENHPDAKKGTNGNRTVASLYDILAARTDKKVKPVGEWNEGRIVVKGDHAEHWLNGEKVLEYNRTSPEFKAHFAESKFTKDTGFCARKDGHILLQDHGNLVSFRNLRIKELN